MPKSKIAAFKETKKTSKAKLSPAERSQVAKDRWAKRRASEMSKSGVNPSLVDLHLEVANNATDAIMAQAVANAPEGADRVDILTEQGTVIASQEIPPQPPVQPPAVSESYTIIKEEMTFEEARNRFSPAPQLAPVAPKKQKRAPQPKEFSGALKAAEKRLANAIVERAKASGQLAMLQAEIPSLIQIINALKGQQNIPAAPYDFNAASVQPYQYAPVPAQFQQPVNDLGAIQAAMDAAQVAMPLSKARGGVQLTPDVVGTLEGPDDDDDEDRFLRGAGLATEGKWIGG